MTLDKLSLQSFIEIHEKIFIVFIDESSHTTQNNTWTIYQSWNVLLYKDFTFQNNKKYKKTYQDWVLTNDPTFKAPKT